MGLPTKSLGEHGLEIIKRSPGNGQQSEKRAEHLFPLWSSREPRLPSHAHVAPARVLGHVLVVGPLLLPHDKAFQG